MSSLRPEKRSLSAMLLECLDQEDMADLYLMGTDDVKIPAYRNVLACQSDFFRNMPAGEVVKLRYSSKVLRAVVNFCITGNITEFDGPFDNEKSAREMVQLIACAHYLGMTHIHDDALAFAKAQMVDDNTIIACAVFDEATLVGESAEFAKLSALDIIRKFPEKTLLSEPGVLAFRQDTLVEVLVDQKMCCEEIVLFRAVNQWATAEVDDGSSDFGAEGHRSNVAKKLAASHINLSAIQPSDLIGIVRNSSLVDENLIFNAFEAQALLAEKEMNCSFSKPRARSEPGVRISGAGEDAVNGFYKEDGKHGGYPKFTKSGVWKGENRTFCVYRWVSGSWYIAIVDKNGRIGESECDFYEGWTKEKVPPKFDGTCPLGRGPCPVLTKT